MTAATDRKAPDTLFAALASVQAQLPKIGKGQTADTGKYTYRYADLADVSQEILPRLGAAGLAFTSRPTILDGQFVLAYSLVHFSGEREDGIYPLPSSGTPQQIGSAITYARRYCLCAVTGVAPDSDDDDGAAAEAGHHQADAAGTEIGEDGWPRGTTARHNADRQAAAVAGEAADDPPWLDKAIERAAAFKSERAGETLWQETVQKANAREITPEDVKRIRELIAAQVEDIRIKAMQNQLRQLAEGDPWRAKVEELDGTDAARTALEELGRTVAASKIPETRAGRIRRAIVARWPHATDTDSEVAA
jgi:hypothetical protein